METPPDAIFEQAGMWKEGGTMFFQDIQRVTRIEEDTREKKLQAQAQARQIIAEAQKAGTAAVEAARRQARDQVSQWMEVSLIRRVLVSQWPLSLALIAMDVPSRNSPV